MTAIHTEFKVKFKRTSKAPRGWHKLRYVDVPRGEVAVSIQLPKDRATAYRVFSIDDIAKIKTLENIVGED